MAYYDALIAAWNGATQPPTGVTGTALTGGMTTAQKLAAVNGWRVAGPNAIVTLSSSRIINSIAPADFAALTQLEVSKITMLITGVTIDVSQGTNNRANFLQVFTGKTQTIANLSALVAPLDNPAIPWTTANGYPPSLNLNDASAAGLS